MARRRVPPCNLAHGVHGYHEHSNGGAILEWHDGLWSCNAAPPELATA